MTEGVEVPAACLDMLEALDTIDESELVAQHGPFLLTKNRAIPTGNPTREQWLAATEWVKDAARASGFWVGDLQIFGERFGEDASQVLDASDLADKTLANAKWVSSQVPPSRRREALSFSHHAEVASLEPVEQDEWLERAEADGLSVHELRGRIRVAKAQAAGHTVELWVMVRCVDFDDQQKLIERMRQENRAVKPKTQQT